MERCIAVADLKIDDAQLVDVRSPSEFAAGHIAGSMNIPLDQIESRVADIRQDGRVILICKAGTRARMAASLISPCRENSFILEGGMDAWHRAGNLVVSSVRTRWSLERQVRFVAGLLVVVGAVLSAAVSWKWVALSGFVGAGLTFSGLTDLCAMGVLLGRMPWNRNSKVEANRDGRGSACVVRY
jgi:rhodanese-related sulfurtransferase